MRRKVNIMHLVLNLDVGGLEWVAVNLLKRLDKRKYNPVVGCLINGGVLAEEIKAIGQDVEILHKPDRLDLGVPFKLAKILRKRKISLLHTHNTGAYLYGGLAARLAGVRTVIHTEHGRDFPDKKRLMIAENILSRFSYRIITVSQDLRDSLVRFEKIRPHKISVIPNGIDTDLFRPLSNGLVRQKKDELGIRDDDYIIGTIGRLVEVKGHKNLIESFAIVRERIPNARLIIVGEGPLKKDLINLACYLGLKNDVLFLGERKDIVEVLNTFDIFVLASKNEGISLTLLEAMAAKRPIVATRVGGNSEIIENGKNGCLVSADSPRVLSGAVLDIAKNPKKAEILSSAAYQDVRKRYSLERMVNDYEKIYDEALGLNILHLRSSPGIFGAERVILNQVRSCGESVFTNHIVCINNLRNQHIELVETAKEMGIQAEYIDCRFRFDFNTVGRLTAILKKKNINILHTHGYKENIIGLFAANLAGVKKIATVHGWTQHTFKVRIYELLDRLILRFFDKIIVVSDSQKEDLIRNGIHKDKIIVIHNSIDVNSCLKNSNTKNIRSEFNIDSNEKIIGTVGRLSQEKGHKYLLYAASRLLAQYPYLRFFIVGDGPDKEDLIGLSETLQIKDRVVFTGYRDDIGPFFSAFDIFVLPSLREGLPSVLLEAFAHSIPVVAANVGGVPELVRHKETGFLVSPKDIEGLQKGVCFFLEDPRQAEIISANAWRLVKENFSLKENAKKMQGLYLSLLER